MTRAVVLLSGGLDSATVLAIARHQKRTVHALSLTYGQRHEIELAAARRVAAAIGVEEHIVYTIDLRAFGGSALTGDIDVPRAGAVPIEVIGEQYWWRVKYPEERGQPEFATASRRLPCTFRRSASRSPASSPASARCRAARSPSWRF